jgi:hypothetical protein
LRFKQSSIYTFSTAPDALPLGHDLPPLNLVCERFQSPQALALYLS